MSEHASDSSWPGARDIRADLVQSNLNRDGNLVLTFVIHPDQKYEVLPITDIHGRAFVISIASPGNLGAGEEGAAAAKQRRIDRMAARQARLESERDTTREDTADDD